MCIGCPNTLVRCTAHTKCPAGKYTKTVGSAAAQPKCQACSPGFFKAVTSNSSDVTDSCTAHSVACPPGKYINETHTAQPRCEACQQGFFKTFTSKQNIKPDSCTAHTKCPPGKYTHASGNATTQPECEACATGFFKALTSISSTCVPSTTVDCGSSVVLFQGTGSSSIYQNSWGGWYSSGSAVKSGSGKRTAYDTLPVSRLRLSDSSGRFVEYNLNAGYAGRTLLSIVQGCMGSSRANTGSSKWNAGLCSNVGTLVSSSGSFGNFLVSSTLRIGVGDGYANSDDWALLMPLQGNGGGDFAGSNAWVFGGESQTNNGHSGTVTILATYTSGR